MIIETTRSMYFLWIGYFQDDSRMHVAVVTEGKRMVAIDDEETVA